MGHPKHEFGCQTDNQGTYDNINKELVVRKTTRVHWTNKQFGCKTSNQGTLDKQGVWL